MCTRHLVLLLAVVLVVAWTGQPADAQDNNLARIYFVIPHAGHGAALEAAIKDHAEWRTAQGDTWQWDVMQVVNGEHIGSFVIRSGDHTWADLDTYAAFQAQANLHWTATVSPHIGTLRSAITSVDMDNIRWPEDTASVNLFSVTTYYLNPGQAQAITEAYTRAHAAIMEHDYDVHYAWDWNVNGPWGQAVSLVSPHANWAGMAPNDENIGAFLIRALGQEEAMELFAMFDGSYTRIESFVLARRPDMSVMPDM